MKSFLVNILPAGKRISAAEGSNLLDILRKHGYAPDAPCGGKGTCGKCRVDVNGEMVLACRTVVDRDMTVQVAKGPENEKILVDGLSGNVGMDPVRSGQYHIAYDIGTTTVVCYLLDGQTGKTLATTSMRNPQGVFGADVISRIQHAMSGHLEDLKKCIQDGMSDLATKACREVGAKPDQIGTVAVVGNPCMQQLFLGISPENLATAPFSPVITKSKVLEAKTYLLPDSNAALVTVPDISGFVGGDTVACLLVTEQKEKEAYTLLVDIGTNGEMVLSGKGRMVACSTAAGPALEGSKIQFGMRGKPGAIDRVWEENGKLCYHVIADAAPIGICGSGLIDAVATMLQLGAINEFGRIQDPESAPNIGQYLGEQAGQRVFYLTPDIYLTQQDIREVQLAKAAIAAGIEMMVAHMGISLETIESVLLAGAFGSAMKPESAVQIGLIPQPLLPKIIAIGNAAGSGAKLLACSKQKLHEAEQLISHAEHLELASSGDFQDVFVENMMFE